MKIARSREVLEALGEGVDPLTGETLTADHLLRRSDVSQAIRTATELMGRLAELIAEDDDGASVDEETARSSVTVHEAINHRFGFETEGGPRRFSKRGWFYVGRSDATCTTCGSRLEAFRCPYISSGRQYHYWALLCVSCRHVLEPADLGDQRKKLYDSSVHRPTTPSHRETRGQGPSVHTKPAEETWRQSIRRLPVQGARGLMSSMRSFFGRE